MEFQSTSFTLYGRIFMEEWKASVRAVKTYLKAVIDDTLLSYEELYTVLTQIEVILNS